MRIALAPQKTKTPAIRTDLTMVATFRRGEGADMGGLPVRVERRESPKCSTRPARTQRPPIRSGRRGYTERMLVLFEDHHLIGVSKPAPLMTQAPAGVPSLEAMVKEYIKEKYAKPAGVYLGIPHRLDRPVSGVVVFCRNTKAAQR